MLMLAQSYAPQMLMAAGVALALVVIMRSLRLRLKRGAEHLTPQERIERIKQKSGMEGDLRQMMVELEDLTRRFSAQLDAKSMRLERLLEEADQRIEELKRLNEAAPRSARPAADVPQQEEPLDPVAIEVYRLADSGKRPLEIARQLDEHVGKVELILALRQA